MSNKLGHFVKEKPALCVGCQKEPPMQVASCSKNDRKFVFCKTCATDPERKCDPCTIVLLDEKSNVAYFGPDGLLQMRCTCERHRNGRTCKSCCNEQKRAPLSVEARTTPQSSLGHSSLYVWQ